MSVTDAEIVDTLVEAALERDRAGDRRLARSSAFGSRDVRQEAIAYIDQRISSPNLRPSSLAEGLHVPRPVLYGAFDADGGIAHFLHERRLAKARLMLRHRAGEPGIIESVAAAHGYGNASRFSRLFASRFAEDPAEFIRKTNVADLCPGSTGREAAPEVDPDDPAWGAIGNL